MDEDPGMEIDDNQVNPANEQESLVAYIDEASCKIVDAKVDNGDHPEPVEVNATTDRVTAETADCSHMDLDTVVEPSSTSEELNMEANGSNINKDLETVAPECNPEIADLKESTATNVTSSSVVVPIVSPVIPSLALVNSQSQNNPTSSTTVKPTVNDKSTTASETLTTASSSASINSSAAPKENVVKLLTYSKSISSALAKPSESETVGEKRKYFAGCCNVNCPKTTDDVLIARKSAIVYFHLNTSIKKVFKICKTCNNTAEAFMQKAVRAALLGDSIFAYKTEPQGMDGDIVEVPDGDEDDPSDIEKLKNEDLELTELTDNFESVITELLNKVDAESQIEKCEKSALAESWVLDRDFLALENKLNFVEKQVAEAKLMYDKITGYSQPIPVVLEQLEIDADGKATRTKGQNPHLTSAKHVSLQADPSLRQKIQQRIDDNYYHTYSRSNENKTVGNDEVMEVGGIAIKNRLVLAPTPKMLPKVIPKVKSTVYGMHRSLLHFWLRGVVQDVIYPTPGNSPEFLIQFEPTKRGIPVPADGQGRDGSVRIVKQVSAKHIAYNIPCPFVLPVGSRVIAKFRDELKMEPFGDQQYYAGIVAEPPKNTNNFRYLIFFDDGYAQYVGQHDVLMVYESSKEVWQDVHPDSADFIKNYVLKYPERPMVRMGQGQIVSTEWNGKWWVARVMEIDCSLVKMKFEDDGRMEWIYRGSTRLSPLFEKLSRQKSRSTARRQTSYRRSNQPTIEYDYDEDKIKNKNSTKSVAMKSTGAPQVSQFQDKEIGEARRLSRLDYGEFEGTIIKKPIPASSPRTKHYVKHECGPHCVYEFMDFDKDFRKNSPLAIPLNCGWSREIVTSPRRAVFYRGPCGKRLRDLEELYDYLTVTKCNISIDHFTFDFAVDCLNEFRHSRQHSFLADLTYGKEQTPVQVVNAFDFDYPAYVEYSSCRIPGQGVHLNTDNEFLVSCDCQDDCRDKSKCACWQLTYSGISFTKLNNEEYPARGYEYRRLKDHIVSGIYECNSRCKCAKTCCNKVVQTGMKYPLQVFKTAAKGWGIRPLFDIPEGSFICIYAGQVLTEQGANEDGKQFGDEYLAELDYIECNEQIKADYESDVTDIEAEDEEMPLARNDKDDGTRLHSSFNPDVRSLSKKIKKRERKPLREYFGADENIYIMDAKTTGNIGRYLNHSCSPNVFVQNVFVDTHDLRFPWVAFFASKHIRAGSELTWDYNYDIGSVPGKVMYCYCGSPDCRGRLL